MTRLTRKEIAMVADRLHLHDCLLDVIGEEAPEHGADLDDIVNACDTTIAELEEMHLEDMVKGLTKVQRFCLIDAVEGATIIPRSIEHEDLPGIRRACRSAARKLSAALHVQIRFPEA